MNGHLPSRGFMAGVVTGILIVSALIAIAIAITVRIPVAINEPPVVYSAPRVLTPMPVCAGDTVRFETSIRFDRPALVQTYLSIRQTGTGRNVPGTQTEMGARPQPTAIEIDDTLGFTVPSTLPPGDYQHVRATVAINMDAQPAFLVIPFTVQDCSKGANE